MYLLRQSQDLLRAVKSGVSSTSIVQELQQATLDDLMRLERDSSKKTFWINLYNAWFQILIQNDIERSSIFRNSPFEFNGISLSLDEIEHGLLRKLQPHPSSNTIARYSNAVAALCLAEPDYRIHFALNCGQMSCPPIAFYNEETIDIKLDLATISYLEAQTEFNPETNIVMVSMLMDWYQQDFGGEAGILKMLKKYGIIPENTRPQIMYRAYNRTTKVMDFSE